MSGRPSLKDPQLLREAAQMIAGGHPIYKAMLHAGYKESVARNGNGSMPKALQKLILEIKTAELRGKGFTLAEIGKQLDPNHVEHAIAGKLYANMLEGKADGNEAAKMLGSMRKFSAFEKDSQVGVIVLQAPVLRPAGKTLKAIDAADLCLPDGEE